MNPSIQQGRREARQLPILRVDGEEYFIDQRLREFRTVTPPIRAIAFVSFDSERGQRLLTETVPVPCDICGAPQILPKIAIPPDVVCFDCAGRLL